MGETFYTRLLTFGEDLLPNPCDNIEDALAVLSETTWCVARGCVSPSQVHMRALRRDGTLATVQLQRNKLYPMFGLEKPAFVVGTIASSLAKGSRGRLTTCSLACAQPSAAAREGPQGVAGEVTDDSTYKGTQPQQQRQRQRPGVRCVLPCRSARSRDGRGCI
jgi:hypothetical protein